MKSFKQFITERPGFKDILSMLIDDCIPFLKEIDGEPDMYRIFRGMEVNRDFMEKEVRKDRKPVDTPPDIHSTIDDWMESEFGVRFRSNSIFASGSRQEVKRYGVPYIIFPKGEFEFLWSPRVQDIFNDVNMKMDTDDIISKLKDAEYTKKDLKGAVDSGNEIMINCKDYYAIDIDLFEDSRMAEELQDYYELYYT